MLLQSYFTTIPIFLLLLVFPHTKANLHSEKQALLDFAAALHHGPKVNWNSSTSICTSWVGVTCSHDGSHVLSVRLPGVGLRGFLPPRTLGKLNGLISLSLRSNSLRGNLPTDLLSLPSLRFVYLQHNNFSGEIPDSLPPRLIFLDLSHNSFTGQIPASIQNLTHLIGFNLQNNSLTGPIPDVNLPSLKDLDLSFNYLNGSIPSGLHKFHASSFRGNLMLCGAPLKQCSSVSPNTTLSPPTVSQRPSDLSNRKMSEGAKIAIVLGGVTLLFLPGLLVVFFCFKKKVGEQNVAPKEKGQKLKEDFGSGVQEPERNKLVFFEGCSYNFDLEDLLRASAEVLGKGNYGTTYKAILEDGTAMVVKRLREVAMGKNNLNSKWRLSKHLIITQM